MQRRKRSADDEGEYLHASFVHEQLEPFGERYKDLHHHPPPKCLARRETGRVSGSRMGFFFEPMPRFRGSASAPPTSRPCLRQRNGWEPRQWLCAKKAALSQEIQFCTGQYSASLSLNWSMDRVLGATELQRSHGKRQAPPCITDERDHRQPVLH